MSQKTTTQDEALRIAQAAVQLMTDFHSQAQPDDTPEMNAVFPAAAFRVFVDGHADLMYRLARLGEPAGAPAAPVKTWRERIGAGPDFPLHGPTDVERAMVGEIEDLRARLKDCLVAPEAAHADDWIGAVVRDVAELPDRDSPPDAPDMMLVTGAELREIVARHAPAAHAQQDAAAADWQLVPKDPQTGTMLHMAWLSLAGDDQPRCTDMCRIYEAMLAAAPIAAVAPAAPHVEITEVSHG